MGGVGAGEGQGHKKHGALMPYPRLYPSLIDQYPAGERCRCGWSSSSSSRVSWQVCAGANCVCACVCVCMCVCVCACAREGLLCRSLCGNLPFDRRVVVHRRIEPGTSLSRRARRARRKKRRRRRRRRRRRSSSQQRICSKTRASSSSRSVGSFLGSVGVRAQAPGAHSALSSARNAVSPAIIFRLPP